MRLQSRCVVFSRGAFRRLSLSIEETGNFYEVGGVLLGHYRFNTYFIIDVTVPVGQIDKSNISFVINGEKETVTIEKIRARYICPPLPLGIWHSHVTGIETFSIQDRISNQKFSQSFDGALSTIAVQSANIGTVKLKTYYIFPDGSEQFCETIVDTGKRIPRCYFKKFYVGKFRAKINHSTK